MCTVCVVQHYLGKEINPTQLTQLKAMLVLFRRRQLQFRWFTFRRLKYATLTVYWNSHIFKILVTRFLHTDTSFLYHFLTQEFLCLSATVQRLGILLHSNLDWIQCFLFCFVVSQSISTFVSQFCLIYSQSYLYLLRSYSDSEKKMNMFTKYFHDGDVHYFCALLHFCLLISILNLNIQEIVLYLSIL